MFARSWGDRLVLLLPGIAMVCTTLIALSPAPFDGLPLYPHSYLLCVCVFTLYAPHMVPLSFVFLFGLVADIVYAMPFGSHGLCAVVLQYALMKMRENMITAPFLFIWGIMAISISCFMMTIWGMSRFVEQTDAPITSMGGLWLSTLAGYPIWHSLGLRILRLLPGR